MRTTISCLVAAATTIAASAMAQPQVIVVAPRSQQVNASPSADIVIRFDRAVDFGTVNSSTVRVFGRWSGPASGTFTMESAGLVVRFAPDASFFRGEWVTVNVRGVEDAGGTPMDSPWCWNYWISTVAGTMDMTYIGRRAIRQSGEGWIQSYGAYAGDLNNDGFSDLAIPNEIPGDLRVFLNNGGGDYSTFVVYALPGGSVPSANEGADFNGDGEIDIVVVNGGNNQASVMIGNGLGGFTSGTSYTGAQTIKGVTVLDVDGDGHDDFITANRIGNNLSLFVNNGSGGFPAIGTAIESGGNSEFCVTAADANNDGVQDIFVGCYNSNEVRILLGDGVGALTYSGQTAIGGKPWMIAAGDINGDGNVDIATANSSYNNAGVAYGNGSGGFSSYTTYPTGGFPLAIDLGDIDGDGDLDLVTSNYNAATWTIYENQFGAFVNVRTLPAQSAGSCAILHDRDNDGDLDLTAIDELDDFIFIYDNAPPPTGGEGPPPATAVATMLENVPNPFNPGTAVRFDLPAPGHAGVVIHDVSGRHVVTLADRVFPAGLNSVWWDGTNGTGARVSSGTYFATVDTGGNRLTRKMTLVK